MYVLFESVSRLWTHEISQPSVAGIVIAILSIIIMPLLAWKKETIGIAIGSKALIADSKETITCAFLSVALLLGLGANWLFFVLAGRSAGRDHHCDLPVPRRIRGMERGMRGMR
jgi:divalent metal cation (Fe/Co/Zn/Cd) transporter